VAMERYRAWLADPLIGEEAKRELRAIEGDPREIEDRFYRDLEFGTGGLRGVIGIGTNRMNVYTVGKATQGLAAFIKEKAAELGRPASAVIAFDSRRMSPEFAEETALVLAANGIKVYLFESLRPTPELSFAVRRLNAVGGVVITASHNPPEYNGYKVYGPDGCQLVPKLAEAVTARIRNVASLAEVHRISRAEAERRGLIAAIGEEIDRAYIEAVTAAVPGGEAARRAAGNLKAVYTPLHGAGNMPVREALKAAGFTNVTVVAEQEAPDGNFPTVASPNPEEREAFALALQIAGQHKADIVIGTDPDCDRMGAAVCGADGTYTLLSGNQAGAVMLHYLLERLREEGRLPEDGAVVKTIVTSELGARIARRHGLKVYNTLTGFKYIGELMTRFAEAGGKPQFLFGYEESYGYLAGNYARDKDGVLASLLICEAAAFYKEKGQTLLDVLEALYREYGWHCERLESRTMKGKDGMERIGAIMSGWRREAPAEVAGAKVREVIDYSLGVDGLPRENALKFMLEDDSWFCLRPSGTEPKIKVYFAVRGKDRAEAEARMARLAGAVMAKVDG